MLGIQLKKRPGHLCNCKNVENASAVIFEYTQDYVNMSNYYDTIQRIFILMFFHIFLFRLCAVLYCSCV